MTNIHPGRHVRRAIIAGAAAAAVLLAGCGSDSDTVDPAAGSTGSTGSAGSTDSTAAAGSAEDTAADTAGSAAAGSAGDGSAAAGESSAAGASPAGGSGESGEISTVAVTITEADGCTVEPNTVPAGPVTFDISNVDATAVVEVHLMAGDRIRGERENLAPGFENTFSVTLDGGAYEIYCPGAKTENQPFTVTGEAAAASGDVSDLLATATGEYAEYVSAQAGFLVEATDELSAAISSGDLPAAQQAYAKARPFFERIEPVAESFGDLDPNIDAREGDVPAADWTGFHPIEQALFTDKDTSKAEPFTAGLVQNVGKLQELTAQLQADTQAGNGKGYQPDEVANGAASLLEEVQASKITGEEERYSHIDLVDFAANVEGSQQAFAALVPALDEIDSAVAGPITEKFDALTALLEAQQDEKALGGYTLYDDLSDAEIKELSDALLAVQEPLSQVPARVASAG